MPCTCRASVTGCPVHDPRVKRIPEGAAELAEAERLMRAIKAPGETVTLEGPLLQRFMAEYDRRGAELERLREECGDPYHASTWDDEDDEQKRPTHDWPQARQWM